MAKTSLFKKISLLVRLADVANKNGWSDSELKENLEMAIENKGRRDFIKKAAITTAGFAGATYLGHMQDAFAFAPYLQSTTDRVAILGAGAAGLAAAYRLHKARIPYVLIDSQNRVGGRIWTADNFNSAGQFVEVGAELVDSGHHILRALVKELHENGHSHLMIEDFAMGDEGLDDFTVFVNGQNHSFDEFVVAMRPLVVRLQNAYLDVYTGGDPNEDDITFRTANPDSKEFKLVHARQYDQLSMRDFLNACANDVEGWVLKVVESAYVGECGLEGDQQSALNLITYLYEEASSVKDFKLYGKSDEVSRVKGGNQRLIDTLYKAITQNETRTGHIHLGQKLTKISHDGQNFDLTFASGEKLNAKQVICTIPFSVLKDVDGIYDLALSNIKKLAIRDLGMGTNAKMFLTFSEKRWRQKDPATNFVPGTEHVRPNTGSIISDLQTQAYWETSRLQKGRHGILTNFLGGNSGLLASDELITTALWDLDRIYPGLSTHFVPRETVIDERIPNAKQAMNWNKSPHVKGSYACLTPGQWTTINGACGEAELDRRLFFAGEHTSLPYQGFMEGGFETGTRAAEEVISSRTGQPVADHYKWAKNVLGIKENEIR